MIAAHPLAVALLATAVLSGGLLAIARIDAATLRIPDALSLPLIGLGLLWAALQAPQIWPQHLIGATTGFLILALIGEVYFRRSGHEGLGLGDAKLFSAAGAWLGWQALPQVLLIAACAGLIFALWRKGRRGRAGEVAFGPWLALGFWLVWGWQTILPLI